MMDASSSRRDGKSRRGSIVFYLAILSIATLILGPKRVSPLGDPKVQGKKKEVNTPKTCLYEVMKVQPDVTQTDLMKTYRSLTIQLHPDKNLGREESANAEMKAVNEAYEILNDVEKRLIYDMFRIRYMKGKMTIQEILQKGNRPQLEAEELAKMEKVHPILMYLRNMAADNKYKGFRPGPESFFDVFGSVFERIVEQEMASREKRYAAFGAHLPPRLGNILSTTFEVENFYTYWENYHSKMDFNVVNQYDPGTAKSRRHRHAMENHNARVRSEFARDYHRTIQQLVAFVKARDPRVIQIRLQELSRLEESTKKEVDAAMEEYHQHREWYYRTMAEMKANYTFEEKFRHVKVYPSFTAILWKRLSTQAKASDFLLSRYCPACDEQIQGIRHMYQHLNLTSHKRNRDFLKYRMTYAGAIPKMRFAMDAATRMKTTASEHPEIEGTKSSSRRKSVGGDVDSPIVQPADEDEDFAEINGDTAEVEEEVEEIIAEDSDEDIDDLREDIDDLREDIDEDIGVVREDDAAFEAAALAAQKGDGKQQSKIGTGERITTVPEHIIDLKQGKGKGGTPQKTKKAKKKKEKQKKRVIEILQRPEPEYVTVRGIRTQLLSEIEQNWRSQERERLVDVYAKTDNMTLRQELMHELLPAQLPENFTMRQGEYTRRGPRGEHLHGRYGYILEPPKEKLAVKVKVGNVTRYKLRTRWRVTSNDTRVNKRLILEAMRSLESAREKAQYEYFGREGHDTEDEEEDYRKFMLEILLNRGMKVPPNMVKELKLRPEDEEILGIKKKPIEEDFSAIKKEEELDQDFDKLTIKDDDDLVADDENFADDLGDKEFYQEIPLDKEKRSSDSSPEGKRRSVIFRRQLLRNPRARRRWVIKARKQFGLFKLPKASKPYYGHLSDLHKIDAIQRAMREGEALKNYKNLARDRPRAGTPISVKNGKLWIQPGRWNDRPPPPKNLDPDSYKTISEQLNMTDREFEAWSTKYDKGWVSPQQLVEFMGGVPKWTRRRVKG